MSWAKTMLVQLREAVRAETKEIAEAGSCPKVTRTQQLLQDIVTTQDAGHGVVGHQGITVVAEAFRSCSKYEAEYLTMQCFLVVGLHAADSFRRSLLAGDAAEELIQMFAAMPKDKQREAGAAYIELGQALEALGSETQEN